jgi:uncharacterized protein
MAPASVRVEVAFSPQAGQVWRRDVSLPDGGTVRDALLASGLTQAFPSVDLGDVSLSVGVWGRRCGLGEGLRDGDRVEVYRPLRVDPNQARLQRHAAERKRKEMAAEPKPPRGRRAPGTR